MTGEIIGYPIGNFTVGQGESAIWQIFIASRGEKIVVVDTNYLTSSLRMTFFENNSLRTLSCLDRFFYHGKKINYRFSFLLNKKEENSLSGIFTYYGERIYNFPFPLTEEEYYFQSNFWRLPTEMVDSNSGLIKIPFLEYQGYKINYTIPLPKLNYPRNKFEEITLAFSPSEVISLIKDLGFGVTIY